MSVSDPVKKAINHELDRIIDGQPDVRLDILCHNIAKNQGFWDDARRDNTHFDLHVWRQISHILIEVCEYFNDAPYSDAAYEELADVIIVTCDLCSALFIPVTSGDLKSRGFEKGLLSAAGAMADNYRKTNKLDPMLAHALIGYVVAEAMPQKDRLMKALVEKIRKNMNREHLYGRAKAEEGVGAPGMATHGNQNRP